MSTAGTVLPVTVVYTPDEATVQGGPFDTTEKAYITSLFGPRAPIQDPDTGQWTGPFHYGLDLDIWPLGEGTVPLHAMFAGVVISKDYNPLGYGHMVAIQSFDGHTIIEYFHMYAPTTLNLGDHVCAGMLLGLVGNTGLSTGPHLHLGLIIDWTYVDPLPWLWGCRDVGELIPGTGYFDEFNHFHDEFGYYQ